MIKNNLAAGAAGAGAAAAAAAVAAVADAADAAAAAAAAVSAVAAAVVAAADAGAAAALESGRWSKSGSSRFQNRVGWSWRRGQVCRSSTVRLRRVSTLGVLAAASGSCQCKS